jgi:hypothetical protein
MKYTIKLIPIIYDECYEDTFAYHIEKDKILATKDYGKSASKHGFKILNIQNNWNTK